MKFRSDLNNGFSKRKLRYRRKTHNLNGLLQIHHVVPKSLADHPTLSRYQYDVDAGYNLILLPTKKGAEVLNVRHTRPIHDGGHPAYNRFCLDELNACYSFDCFCAYLLLLHMGCRGRSVIPWK